MQQGWAATAHGMRLSDCPDCQHLFEAAEGTAAQQQKPSCDPVLLCCSWPGIAGHRLDLPAGTQVVRQVLVADINRDPLECQLPLLWDDLPLDQELQ